MPSLLPFEDRSAEHLRLVLDTSQIGIWELDLGSGLAVRNETHDRIFGYDEPLAEWSYDQFLEHVVENDRAKVDELQRAAIENDREWSFECQIKTATGEFRWIKAAGRPLQGDGEQAPRLIGHVIDITEAKQSEARLRLITDELNHRVRNMLAMIKSMVRMTARSSNDIGEFAEALEGRVGALSRTQNMLVSNASASMMPSAIVEAELSAFDAVRAQVHISVNDEGKLSASGAQGLALVLHELFTNAIKYGALSTEAGTVSLRIDRVADTVKIAWEERGGPAPEQGRTGFGSLLISQALGIDGTAEQVFSPTGLDCRITLAVG